MYLPWEASHLAFAFAFSHLKQNDKGFKEYRLPLGCLCPWIERLNILGCRRSGYISGLLKFCVSASFWQFRDI